MRHLHAPGAELRALAASFEERVAAGADAIQVRNGISLVRPQGTYLKALALNSSDIWRLSTGSKALAPDLSDV